MTDGSSKEALRFWLAVPAEIRRLLLDNVWCPDCGKSVTIVDFSAKLEGESTVLQGFCGACGHKVARALEGCGRAPKKIVSRRNYIFDVWLYGDEGCAEEKKIIRRIQIPGGKSLYSFAEFIIKAFEFQFDHCFGFYDTLKDKKNCKKAFELFVDVGEEATRPNAKGVKKIKVFEAFDDVGEKLILLFDYGDGWQFHVVLREICEAQKGDLRPVVLESIGEAPEQYPPCEDEG